MTAAKMYELLADLEQPCIRVDGVPFPVTDYEGNYVPWIMAAQCSAPGCVNRLFVLNYFRSAGNYVCATCDEPYTIRMLIRFEDETLGALLEDAHGGEPFSPKMDFRSWEG
jgi:hypothetical protein